MLSARELAWWPLAPLLLAQGLGVRLRTARLPPAAGERGRAGAGRRLVRLTGLGDSIIAGIGVQRGADGLVGQVAARLAERADVTVEWRAIGQSGATAEVVLQQWLDSAVHEAPSLLLISAGVNDAVAGTNPSVFQRHLRALVDALTAGSDSAVVFAGIPPLSSFPALPRPLSTLLGRRAADLAQAATALAGYRGLQVVTFPATLDRDGFASDGFHPGPRACRIWSQWVAQELAGGAAGRALELA